MSVLFKVAIRNDWATVNPCTKVDRNIEKTRDRYIEDWEFLAVKSVSSAKIQAIMDLAYVTAMRQGDLLSLRTDQVTDKGIRLKQGKTGKRQIMAWNPALRDGVARLRAMGPPLRPTLICTDDGHQYTESGFRAMWRRYVTKAIDAGLIVERFTFHDIRAKSLTDAEQQGLDPQRLAGHSTPQQTETYLRSKRIDKVTPLDPKL